MTITLTPELEQEVAKRAQDLGTTPEGLVLERLRHDFLVPARTYPFKTLTPPPAEPMPHDEWMRRLRSIGVDCGVSLTDEQVSRESLYDDHL